MFKWFEDFMNSFSTKKGKMEFLDSIRKKEKTSCNSVSSPQMKQQVSDTELNEQAEHSKDYQLTTTKPSKSTVKDIYFVKNRYYIGENGDGDIQETTNILDDIKSKWQRLEHDDKDFLAMVEKSRTLSKYNLLSVLTEPRIKKVNSPRYFSKYSRDLLYTARNSYLEKLTDGFEFLGSSSTFSQIKDILREYEKDSKLIFSCHSLKLKGGDQRERHFIEVHINPTGVKSLKELEELENTRLRLEENLVDSLSGKLGESINKMKFPCDYTFVRTELIEKLEVLQNKKYEQMKKFTTLENFYYVLFYNSIFYRLIPKNDILRYKNSHDEINFTIENSIHSKIQAYDFAMAYFLVNLGKDTMDYFMENVLNKIPPLNSVDKKYENDLHLKTYYESGDGDYFTIDTIELNNILSVIDLQVNTYLNELRKDKINSFYITKEKFMSMTIPESAY